MCQIALLMELAQKDRAQVNWAKIIMIMINNMGSDWHHASDVSMVTYV